MSTIDAISSLLFSTLGSAPARRVDRGDARPTETPGSGTAAGAGRAADSVTISAEARAAQSVGANGQPLSEAELEQVRELRRRDREVRAHETAHKAAAGAYARGGPSYEYQTGPDGRRYAVGGHVEVDTSAVPGDPDATLAKMQTIQRAANAPAEPSGADRRVAAKAAQQAAAARAEKRETRDDEHGPQRADDRTTDDPAATRTIDDATTLPGDDTAGSAGHADTSDADRGAATAPTDSRLGRLIDLLG